MPVLAAVAAPSPDDINGAVANVSQMLAAPRKAQLKSTRRSFFAGSRSAHLARPGGSGAPGLSRAGCLGAASVAGPMQEYVLD